MTHRERDIFLATAIRGRQRAQEMMYTWSVIVRELTQLEEQLRRLPVDGDPAAAAEQATAEDLDLIPGWPPDGRTSQSPLIEIDDTNLRGYLHFLNEEIERLQSPEAPPSHGRPRDLLRLSERRHAVKAEIARRRQANPPDSGGGTPISR